MSRYEIKLHQLTPEPRDTVFVVSYNGCYLDTFGAWVEAGYGGELPVPLDCAALAVFAIVGLALAASLLGREGGVTRAALRERA